MRHVCATLFAVTCLAASPALAQQPRTLAAGQTVEGELRDGDPVGRTRRAPYHVWLLDGRRAQRVVLDMISPDFDTYLVVRDPDGFLVGQDDDSGDEANARVRLVLPRDGRYRVIATAFSEDGRGHYTLSASTWQTPAAPAAGQVTALAIGQAADGVLEPGDEVAADGGFQDRWTVEARAGQRFRVEMRSQDFDAYLIVLGPNGAEIASDDDGLGGRDATVAFRAAAAGRHTVVATSYQDNPTAGVYRIELVEESGRFAEPGMTAAIAGGQTLEGRLENGDLSGSRGYEDRWTFQGRQGQMVRIDVMSTQFDPYAVLRVDEMAVDSNDDGGEGTDSRLVTVLPRTGAYTLIVSPYSETRSGGLYRVALAFTEPPRGAGEIARIRAGERQSGRLEPGDRRREAGGYADWWEFDGRAGQQVLIDMRSREFDAYLELYDPQGNLLGQDDDGGDGTDSHLSLALPGSGRYRIVARSFGSSDRSGLYELELEVAAPAAPPGRVQELRENQAVLGRLEEGDSLAGDSTWIDVYLFRAPRDGRVTVELGSGDFDTYLIVAEVGGATIGTDDDGGEGTNSQLTFAVRGGRTYRIVANSFGSEPSGGTYRIRLRYGE